MKRWTGVFAPTALMVAVIFGIAVLASSAHANPLVHWHHDWKPRHHHVHHAKRHHAKKPVSKPTAPTTPTAPKPNRKVRYVAAQTQQQCSTPNFNIVGFLQEHGANVLKFGTTPYWASVHAGVQCVQTARAAGYPIYLNIDWPGSWSTAQIVPFVKQTMSEFGGSYFAVALGNEMDIHGLSASEYFSEWQRVAPIVHAMDPGARLVLADGSPWSVNWIKSLAAMHPVDANAVGFHCYNVTNGGGLQSVPQLAAYLAAYKLPLWCSEMAPDLNAKTSPAWAKTSSLAAWNATVQQIVNESPDLQMTSYYRWPQLGAN